MARRALRAVCVTAAVLGVCVLARALPRHHHRSKHDVPPPELAEPGLRAGPGDRTTWVVLAEPRAGELTQIVPSPPGAAPDELLLVGTEAALRTAAPPDRFRWTDFEDQPTARWRVESADLDGDGHLEFVNRSGNWHPASIYEADGGTRWYEGSRDGWGVNQLSIGNLDGDGRADLVAAYNRQGLRRLDADGHLVWERPEVRARDVALADLDGDGRDEILHAYGGKLGIRNAAGDLLREIPIKPSMTEFALTRWGSADGALQVGHLDKDQLWLTPLEHADRSRSLPLGMDLSRGDLSLVSFQRARGEAPALAALVDFRLFERAVLDLYAPDGALLHREVLPWSCPTLAVDTRDPEADVLLLGCSGGRLVANGPHAPLFRRVLALHQAFAGGDAPELLDELRNLAWALVHGDHASEALPHAQRALALASRAPDPFEVTASLNTLGMVESALGRHTDAFAHLQRALTQLNRAHPRAAKLEADIHYNLAEALAAEHQLDAAAGHYRTLLAAWPHDAQAEHNLASIYLEQRRLADAQKMIELAIEHDTAAGPARQRELRADERLRADIQRAQAQPAQQATAKAKAPPAQTPPASAAED